MTTWALVGAVTTAVSIAAWAATALTGRVKTTFLVGFNVMLPVAALHLLGAGAPSWRDLAALATVALYLANMNLVMLGWSSHTALSKLDGALGTAEKHVLPFVMTQAAGWLYCLPFAFVARREGPVDAFDVVGFGVFAAGFALHFAADLQKKRFKERPENRGEVLDTGLWAWSRHPNYLGDFVLYVGWAVLSASPWGLVCPAANLLQYWFDAIPKNETWAAERYGAAWTAYAARTPKFFPRIRG